MNEALSQALADIVSWTLSAPEPPRGLQLLWPLNHEWYISGLDVFRQTARLRIFTRGPMMTNLRAVVQELAILGPAVTALWLVRVKTLTGLAAEVPGRHHPAQ